MKSITNGKMNCAIRNRRDSRQGFTLIEAMLALLILAAIVVPLLEVNSRSWSRAANSNNIMTATDIARALLESSASDRVAFGMIPLGEDAPFENSEDYPGFRYRTMKQQVQIDYADNKFKVPGLYRITAEVKFIKVDAVDTDTVILERFVTVPKAWENQ